MKRVVILYALGLAAGAFLLQWLQYNYLVRIFSTEIYIGLIAVAFAGLGVWAGMRLARRPASATFEKNTAAIAALGITLREQEVLALLASGKSNKEISGALNIAEQTVKTHVSHILDKLGVPSRTQAALYAIRKGLVPPK